MNGKNGGWVRLLLRHGMKPAVLALSMVLMISSVASGSLAWLTAETHTITNTFTYGDIWLDLQETDADGDGDPNNNRYEMNPGADIAKDPWVTVFKNSKDSWVFVELIESANFDEFMEYAIADGWTKLLEEGTTRVVYYREVCEASADQSFIVLKDNQVHVKDTVTKEQFEALTYYPTLQIKAYAVQKDEAINSADAAWQIITTGTLPEQEEQQTSDEVVPQEPLKADELLQENINTVEDVDSFIDDPETPDAATSSEQTPVE